MVIGLIKTSHGWLMVEGALWKVLAAAIPDATSWNPRTFFFSLEGMFNVSIEWILPVAKSKSKVHGFLISFVWKTIPWFCFGCPLFQQYKGRRCELPVTHHACLSFFLFFCLPGVRHINPKEKNTPLPGDL